MQRPYQRAAKELLDVRLGEAKQHSFTPDRQRLTFSGLCSLFLESKVKARKTTLDGYRELINCYLLPYFGADRKIETLRRFEVEQYSRHSPVRAKRRSQGSSGRH